MSLYVILKVLSCNIYFLPIFIYLFIFAAEYPQNCAVTKLWCKESFHYYISFIKGYIIRNSSESVKFLVCLFAKSVTMIFKSFEFIVLPGSSCKSLDLIEISAFDLISDSRRGFEYLRLNFLLSWVFSSQDKMIKIILIINGSVTFTCALIWKSANIFALKIIC